MTADADEHVWSEAMKAWTSRRDVRASRYMMLKLTLIGAERLVLGCTSTMATRRTCFC